MVETPPVFHELRHRLPDGRSLAGSCVGQPDAEDVLLCLPGLLETRHSFDAVLQAASSHPGLRVVALDHAGRGDASPLPGDHGYGMSVYLDDVRQFITTELLRQRSRRLHLLGTSMGGLLGLYLAADASLPVRTLILNDVGLSFYWVSLYGLYDGMKQGIAPTTPEALAAQLGVTPGVLRAVQSPHHFDVPFRKDWKGMRFAHLLQHYTGAVRLVHGSASGVCLDAQVQELRQQVANARVLTVEGAGHPVPFTPAVCEFVLADLAAVTPSEAAPAVVPPVVPTPVAEAPPRGFWRWLRDKFR